MDSGRFFIKESSPLIQIIDNFKVQRRNEDVIATRVLNLRARNKQTSAFEKSFEYSLSNLESVLLDTVVNIKNASNDKNSVSLTKSIL